MKKIFLLILFLCIICSFAFSGSLTISNDSILLESKAFSFDIKNMLLFYKGDYISYGRLDSYSLYNSLFNPYRKYLNVGLSVSKSQTRGLRGFLIGYKQFSFAFSFSGDRTAALSYDGKYLDIGFAYYDEKDEMEKSIIYNYKREERDDVLSLLLRTFYLNYIDGIVIFSYSPHLGIDGFYRITLGYEGVKAAVSYGNTLLSNADDLLKLDFSLSSSHFDFRYSMKYSEEPLYTDFFRVYSSSYETVFKYNGIRASIRRTFSFDKRAEIKDITRISLFYKGLRLSVGSDLAIHLDVEKGAFKMGIKENGSYFEYEFSENFLISYYDGKIGAEVKLFF